MYYLGAIILLLLAAQLFVTINDLVRRTRSAASQADLEKQLIQQKVEQIIDHSKQQNVVTEPWSGWRKFRVSNIVQENSTIKSFYLEPHDGKPLPAFKPGQYLTFQLKVPGRSKPIVRSYSLSDSPLKNDFYRVTIRKHLAPLNSDEMPDGVSSCYFHDDVRENDILDVKAPTGNFYLDLTEKTPVVLIAGGIGITPLLSMLNTLYKTNSERKVWLFML